MVTMLRAPRDLSIYVARGAFVASMFPRSHVYALTAPHDVIHTWRDSNATLETPREHLDRLLQG